MGIAASRKQVVLVSKRAGQIGTAEYIVLMALLTSIAAMATDVMLPALDIIGQTFNVNNATDVHLVVTLFFFGMALGQLVAGPMSDALGRRPVIISGYFVFIVGCVLSIIAESWFLMLLGRVLQGMGAAAPRTVTVAMVRDEFEGRAMARILSFVMAVFILVPIVAPALGQGLIYIGGWKATLLGLIVLAMVVVIWFGMRQKETLVLECRRPIKLVTLRSGLIEIATNQAALGYTIATGFIYGVFVGYLGLAQLIFQETFQVGNRFPLFFALAAASIGIASLANASLVMRFGMRKLTGLSLVCLTLFSGLFAAVLPVFNGVPPIHWFLIWQLLVFFCVGLVFGNLNALALEPLGHIAGLGAAFVGSISIFMSLPLAWLVANHYDGTVYSLVAGFAILGAASCMSVVWVGSKRQPWLS